ncbi:ornithine carbamoyltransferase [Deinococcus radiodurans R1 = ATCC 13939 = DSM 20539]|nr:ornithine carbamoyltransferase [Deinococcus radiodurans R1 = ATCC 13939 = DSM 20539]ANC72629.1 ornithine carbamoyltransferase [Deinococcus radiodurans R1 = ATCC 13939 = DSM 20539]QEM72056.1 ornithine carbamoyltransferase [Deinococcus radiodurans]UDK99291.1 ornithine carbamoyltransferase [Deinococcus radiodurans R1 = ATCC 13939 = DSM 20539]UID69091.1 ornithine carbamoyltransferase [Deinococcus radiodurans R1 = ATCC 13939 = DSM 20539]
MTTLDRGGVYFFPMTKAARSSKKSAPSVPTPAQARLHTPDTLPRPVLAGRDFLSNLDMTSAELRAVMDTAHSMKAGEWRAVKPLSGLSLALVFEKASLRTRTTFDVGMYQLGGHAITLSNTEIGLGTRERVSDVARNLERWVDGVMGRVYLQQTLVELAQHARIPVINGLSDMLHPAQLLADYQTIEEEFGQDLRGKRVVYIGDGNNLANSHIHMGILTGTDVTVVTPVGYEPNAGVLMDAVKAGVEVHLTNDLDAIQGADVLYTDVWISMGQEAEADIRRRAFRGYQVTPEMLETISPDGIFLHCLPAHYGEETVPEATEHPKSRVFDQAENRLHAQKALLYHVLGDMKPRW